MSIPFGETGFGSGEAALRRETVAWLHAFRDSGLQRDEIAAIMPSTSSFPESPGRYVLEEPANEVAPIQHYRLAFRPLVHGSRLHDIALMHARIPTPHYERQTATNIYGEEYETRETPQWNDVFIELLDDSEQLIKKYFMNQRLGPVAYETAQSGPNVQADIVRNYVDFEQSGDFFMTSYSEALIVPDEYFNIQVLRGILGSYTMAKQSNRPV